MFFFVFVLGLSVVVTVACSRLSRATVCIISCLWGAVSKWQHFFTLYNMDIVVCLLLRFVFISFHGELRQDCVRYFVWFALNSAFDSDGLVGCCEIVVPTVSLILLLKGLRRAGLAGSLDPSVGAPGPRRAFRTRTLIRCVPFVVWENGCFRSIDSYT